MSETIKIKKGLDIHLKGEVEGKVVSDTATRLFGIVPDDFPGWKWRLTVREGDHVAKGAPLLEDKSGKGMKITAPVAGTVSEVRRGERRKIEAVVIEKAADEDCAQLSVNASGSRQELVKVLCESGLWALMRQRPYDTVPDPEVMPRDIFVTSFDSAPLAPELISASDTEAHKAGLAILAKLTEGKVYLGIRDDANLNSDIARVYEFHGPHPAGNVGVQIANIKPVNKGETVWALDSRTVVRIGRLFTTGELDTAAEVAITGPEVKEPKMVKTTVGASLGTLLKGELANPSDDRVISGNVLTGWKSDPARDFLRWPYRQVTVIREGAHADEFMGWASVSPKKYSVKRSFPAFLRGLSKPFDFDARIKGGHRAMILSGEYDKVFPFDIYPEFLLKAIMAFDIDKMEQLGIYEVAPEDFALPEFVDTSKIELQKVVREGLEKLRNEVG